MKKGFEIRLRMKKSGKYYVTLDRLIDFYDSTHFENFFSKHNQRSIYVSLCQTRDQSMFDNLIFCQIHVKRTKRDSCARNRFLPNRVGWVGLSCIDRNEKKGLFLLRTNRMCLKLSQTLNITKDMICSKLV